MLGQNITPQDHRNTQRLFHYWAHGEGVAKWATSPHPWTTLRDLLLKYVTKDVADGLASKIFRAHFGYWPGDRKGTNPVGRG